MAIEFDTADKRVGVAQGAGEEFEAALEFMAETLSDTAGVGSSLGTMVMTQLGLTEKETTYSVKKGLPEKPTKTVSQVGQKISQQAG